MGKYEAINEAPIYVLEGDEDFLEEERYATDDVLIDNADMPWFLLCPVSTSSSSP